MVMMKCPNICIHGLSQTSTTMSDSDSRQVQRSITIVRSAVTAGTIGGTRCESQGFRLSKSNCLHLGFISTSQRSAQAPWCALTTHSGPMLKLYSNLLLIASLSQAMVYHMKCSKLFGKGGLVSKGYRLPKTPNNLLKSCILPRLQRYAIHIDVETVSCREILTFVG
jgi:hypothetical protein